jgi:RNA polymerase sigma-70 factor (ECF subfamily)
MVRMRIPMFLNSIASLSDEELMKRVASKDDERAFDELYHRHARRVMGFLMRQLGDSERAADLVQDAFLRLWSSRERYLSGKCFSTWLFSIAYNLLKNEYRRSGYSVEYAEHVINSTTEEQNDDLDVRLDDKLFDAALRQELSLLDAESRLLFSLRFEEEMTVPQIAEVMKIPEGTVKSRQHTIIRNLKQKLKIYEIRR